jgi:alpha-ketoglutarate-dependent taurine dioxygenase
MTQLSIHKLAPTLGAEVQGFDPDGEIDAGTWRQLSQAFDEHGVLVFRDIALDVGMQHLIVETLFANGDAVAGAAAAAVDREHFSYVSNREKGAGAPDGRLLWHSDMMWSDIANQVASLWAQDAEQPTVPTTFTSAVQAWDTLPEALKARVKGLHARQVNDQQGRGNSKYEDELPKPMWDKLRETVTPVAMPHPRTGQTMLYVCELQTREIVGLPRNESDDLLDALFEHLYRPERVYEHQWRKHDLILWDNQATQHGRPYVQGTGPARTLRKIHAPSKILRQFGKPSYARAPAAAD